MRIKTAPPHRPQQSLHFQAICGWKQPSSSQSSVCCVRTICLSSCISPELAAGNISISSHWTVGRPGGSPSRNDFWNCTAQLANTRSAEDQEAATGPLGSGTPSWFRIKQQPPQRLVPEPGLPRGRGSNIAAPHSGSWHRQSQHPDGGWYHCRRRPVSQDHASRRNHRNPGKVPSLFLPSSTSWRGRGRKEGLTDNHQGTPPHPHQCLPAQLPEALEFHAGGGQLDQDVGHLAH